MWGRLSMNENKISIVIPVFNNEKNIEQCVNSILSQQYNNFEIVIVNDGSYDGTRNLLEKHYSNNEKVKIINTENQGVSLARNQGIDEATGNYLLFVDADDVLVENALSSLNERFVASNADLILFGFSVIGDKNRKNDTVVLQSLEKGSINNDRIIKSLLSTKDNLLGYVWRAAYSLKLIKTNKINFQKDLKISEDYLFVIQAIIKSKRILPFSQELYEYHLGESSMSNKYIPSLLSDMLWVNNWIKENIISKNPTLDFNFQSIVMNTYILFVQNTMRDKKQNYLKKIIHIYQSKKKYRFQKAIHNSYKNLNCFCTKSKFAIILFRFNMEFIYVVLFTIKNM